MSDNDLTYIHWYEDCQLFMDRFINDIKEFHKVDKVNYTQSYYNYFKKSDLGQTNAYVNGVLVSINSMMYDTPNMFKISFVKYNNKFVLTDERVEIIANYDYFYPFGLNNGIDLTEFIIDFNNAFNKFYLIKGPTLPDTKKVEKNRGYAQTSIFDFI